MTARRRVVAVTGGGGGIGAAVATAVARSGAHVVTMDPLVSLDGSARLPDPAETTAGRIVAAGGSAEATSVSVTDGDAVRDLFERLAGEHDGLDAVINVAGISRPTGFAKGDPDDWRSVLSVHLDGYLNVLRAALPLMAAARHGHIVGVTSGSGWRPADAGAYSCAKRAVASLTWQLGRVAPEGVTVKAMSPIAVTRMVTAALGRPPAPAGAAPRGPSSGGLSLGSMPQPEELGPLGAHLASDASSWCQGRIVFAGGSEAAIVEAPRLLEVVRTDGVPSLPHLLDAVTPAWVAAEQQQGTTGATNPRFASAFAGGQWPDLAPPASTTCAVLTDDPTARAALSAALADRGVTCTDAVDARTDAVVLVAGGSAPVRSGAGWERVLAEHAGIVEQILADSSAARSVAEHASATTRPVRLVTLVDATTAGGRSRAQAAAQLSRAAAKATDDQVAAFALSVECASDDPGVAALAAHLVASGEAAGLRGAELVAGAGWCGLRSHPRPSGSIAFGGPELPPWFDDALRAIAGA